MNRDLMVGVVAVGWTLALAQVSDAAPKTKAKEPISTAQETVNAAPTPVDPLKAPPPSAKPESKKPSAKTVETPATEPLKRETGRAIIRGTAEKSKIAGTAIFTPTSGGMKVEIQVTNVPPGKHGLHIHEHNSCADGGNAAGGHYNPESAPHGFITAGGFEKAHAGDFGNLEVGPNGTGKLELLIPGLSLTDGRRTIGGRSIILHEKEDAFGQPTGNAGGRIGCGVIEVVND